MVSALKRKAEAQELDRKWRVRRQQEICVSNGLVWKRFDQISCSLLLLD